MVGRVDRSVQSEPTPVEVAKSMKDVFAVLGPIVAAIIVAVSASVFTRRKYDAEIRGMDAATNGVAVATIAATLKHQQEYIEGLEARLTRTEAAADKALQAEQTCRQQLFGLQVRFADLEHQLIELQKAGR